MCDIYVPSIGYVCWECKAEFKEQMGSKREFMSGQSVERELKAFMDTHKSEWKPDILISVDEFFKKHEK